MNDLLGSIADFFSVSDLTIFLLFHWLLRISIIIVIVIYLYHQLSFAKSIKTEENEDSQFIRTWVWTQIIPIWSIYATYMALKTIKRMYLLYESTNESTLKYNDTPMWIAYILFTISYLTPKSFIEDEIAIIYFSLVFIALLSTIYYWIHIKKLTKKVLKYSINNKEIVDIDDAYEKKLKKQYV